MVPMPSPSVPSLDPDVTPAAVIEFGPEPSPGRRLGLAGDRRVVPLAAGLAAVAAFGSLVSEWQLTNMDGSVFGGGDPVGNRTVPADLSDLGAAGTGYLVALFPLVAAVVLTMFGPAAGRAYARLTGLAVGGTLFGLLLAMTVSLGDQSRIISRLYTEQTNGGEVSVSYGRGLWCALFAVAAALAALYLAGQHDGGWSAWRPPRTERVETDLDEPFELTVSSAQPFEDQDGNYRPGISG
jgi:hypothetical protein